MRGPLTIWRYVGREVALYTAVGLAGVSLIFVGGNLLRYAGQLLAIGATPPEALRVLRAVAVATLVYALPIGFLFGALAGLGRLAADREVGALRACGVGVAPLLAPTLALGIAASALTWYLALGVEHRAKREMRDVLLGIGAARVVMEPREFTHLPGRTLYVSGRDGGDRLSGVFIADRSNPERPMVLFARSGSLEIDRDAHAVHLLLRDGDVYFEPTTGSGKSRSSLAFEQLDYAFEVPFARTLGRGWLRPRDMSTAELRAAIAHARAGGSLAGFYEKRVEEYELQLERRYALPAAPIVFALVAVPLALRRGRAARSRGALLCALLIGAYYGALATCQALVASGAAPARVALWGPNVIFAALGAALLARTRRAGA
jgi:lipopolysaccharide export system permease protein